MGTGLPKDQRQQHEIDQGHAEHAVVRGGIDAGKGRMGHKVRHRHHIAVAPGDDPAQYLTHTGREDANEPRRQTQAKAQGYYRPGEQVGDGRNQGDCAEIQAHQRHRKHHRRQGNGEILHHCGKQL